MQLIYNNSTDCYFNLALEEYLLRQTNEDFIILWRSEDSVVIGKHQNLHAELVEPVAIDNNIKIARRLSGGGTVFHDLGNLNFSFIKNGEVGKLVDFKQFISPLANFLNELGVPAQLSERNDIMIEGKKVSGNAEHVFKNRVLHHGTLLFSSSIDKLSSVLRKDPSAFQGKAVQSVRKAVTKISDYLPQALTIDEFINRTGAFLQKYFSADVFEFSNDIYRKIDEIAQNKYRTEEWIYDYSPKFNLEREISEGEVSIVVKNGKIEAVSCSDPSLRFLTSFIGKRFCIRPLTELCETEKQRDLVVSLFLD